MGLMFNAEKSDYPAYEYLIVGLYEGLSLFACRAHAKAFVA